MFGESVTIQTASATTVDAYSGTEVPDWSQPPNEFPVPNVLVGAGGSTESNEAARNAVTSDFDLIFQPPYTTLPTAQDRVVVRGLVCEIDGRPFGWKWAASPGDAGTVVRASIKEG